MYSETQSVATPVDMLPYVYIPGNLDDLRRKIREDKLQKCQAESRSTKLSTQTDDFAIQSQNDFDKSRKYTPVTKVRHSSRLFTSQEEGRQYWETARLEHRARKCTEYDNMDFYLKRTRNTEGSMNHSQVDLSLLKISLPEVVSEAKEDGCNRCTNYKRKVLYSMLENATKKLCPTRPLNNVHNHTSQDKTPRKTIPIYNRDFKPKSSPKHFLPSNFSPTKHTAFTSTHSHRHARTTHFTVMSDTATRDMLGIVHASSMQVVPALVNRCVEGLMKEGHRGCGPMSSRSHGKTNMGDKIESKRFLKRALGNQASPQSPSIKEASITKSGCHPLDSGKRQKALSNPIMVLSESGTRLKNKLIDKLLKEKKHEPAVCQFKSKITSNYSSNAVLKNAPLSIFKLAESPSIKHTASEIAHTYYAKSINKLHQSSCIKSDINLSHRPISMKASSLAHFDDMQMYSLII